MRSEKYPNSGPIYTFFFYPPPPVSHYPLFSLGGVRWRTAATA